MARPDRRVVISGVGVVSALGTGTQKNWDALLAGQSGVRTIDRFDAAAYPVRIAGQVHDFEPNDFFGKKELKKVDRFCQLAIAAADFAMADSGLQISPQNADRVGAIVGVGMGGIATIEETHIVFLEAGLKRVSPFFIPRLIASIAPAQIAMRHGCKGVNYTSTSACASGGHAIGEAYRQVRFGYQDALICGGAEAPITPIGVGGFAVMRALSTRNDEPERASRPFDRGRDGFVIAEGAGILIVEALDLALERKAPIYAEVVGYGANCDAYHLTAPSPDGQGAARCMQLALEDGEIDPSEVDYINAHGTSTPANDPNETQAIKHVFGEHAKKLAVSSTKSMTGHILGGAGGVEAVYTALAIRHGWIPPTINYEDPDPECDLDYVPNQARQAKIRVALSNSFGFGGANACVAFRRWDDSDSA